MKLHGAMDLDKNISFPKVISLLKVQGKTMHKSYGFGRLNQTTLYILKLHGARNFNKYISSPKAISLPKVQDITRNQF